MFNLTAPTNIRCNGVVNTASKTTTVPRVQRSPTTSIPSLINKDTTTTHSTLKYVDNNKITSNSCSFLIKKEVSYDDPYAFHDSEVNLLNSATLLKKQLIKTEPPQSSSPNNKNNVHNININNTNTNTTTTTLALLNPNLIKSEKQTNNNNDGGGGVCSKTMNKLQAQIARHKVNVKHKKEISPVPNNITKIESSVDVKPSIIDISDNNSTVYRKLFTDTGNNLTKTRRVNLKTTHHETLQRIRTRKRVWHAPYQYGNVCDAFSLSDTDDSDMDEGVMTLGNINHWSTLIGVDREMHIQRNRERMARALYKQKLERINDNMNCHRTIKLIGAMQGTQCSQIANIILQQHSRFRDRLQHRSSSSGLLPPRQCSYDGDGGPCKAQALPCTRHCGRHIMYNSDQLLYDYCTAKFADNTQCCIPVFDLNHELPLCIEHARKRDNYNKMCQVVKPKKPRKKVKPSAMIRPQKRSKKRKRPSSSQHSSSSSLSSQHHHVSKTTSNNHLHQHQHHDKQHVQLHSETKSSTADINVAETSSACDSSDDLGLSNPLAESTELSTPNHFGGDEPDDDMVAQVLGVGEELPLELAGPAEALVNQASRLLEETDLTNVFNQIPPDAFNDLFAIDRNGVYEPTREETEELERALEAVNQDVKSLEKMSQTQGILDSLLDEHALVESLAHMPDVFPNLNGFSVTSSSSVAQTVSSTVPTVIPSRIHNLDNIISVQQPPAHMPS